MQEMFQDVLPTHSYHRMAVLDTALQKSLDVSVHW